MEIENDGAYKMARESFAGALATVIDAPTQLNPNFQADAQITTRNPLIARLLGWLFPEQRNSNRFTVPNLIAFLGSVRTSQAYDIGDVSSSGCYMITRERWISGTVMPMTLLRTKKSGQGIEATITLQSTVVRSGPDGVGFEFVREGCMTEELDEFLEGLKLPATDEPDLMRAS